MARQIANRVAAVTGGARGIGRAIAHRLLQEGARVAILDLDEAEAATCAEALKGVGPEVRAYPLDVTRLADVHKTLARVEAELGPIDFLINNAGIMPLGAFLDQSPESDQRQVDVNLFGVLNGMRAMLPLMEARKRGHIVNIASVAGCMPAPYAAVYSATKYAVIGATESIRFEYAGSGLDFSYILPALVDTELISGTGRPRYPPPVQPRDVADAVLRALQTGRVEIFVPRFSRLSVLLPALLPRRVYERIGRVFGVDEMFASVDEEGRASYRNRIRH
jgi:NAD(P)-dependent dehydrogenase (short-subunit alcohol dehydrogenase family)